MTSKTFRVGIGSFQPYMTREVVARSARGARWTYVNLYAPPGTRYSDTWCNGVRAQQPRAKAKGQP